MFPNNFIYSDYWLGSSAYVRDSSGYYWSASAGNSSDAYYLSFYSAYVSPGDNSNYYKFYGFSVRCVAGS